MTKRILLAAVAALFLFGCGEKTHDFKIRFQDVQKLQKNDRVVWEDKAVGQVKDVAYTPAGDFLVDVAITDPFVNLATDASRFYIDVDPELAGKKAILVVNSGSGKPIQRGAVVEGQTKTIVMYDQIVDGLRLNIRAFEAGINEFLQELQNFSESEQVKQLERELDRILAEIKDLSAEMKEKLQKEILPLIRQRIEELRRRLQQRGAEDKLGYVDQKIKQIYAGLET